MPVRAEIVAALVHPLVELQPASTVEAFATSLTTTATSPLHVIGFVSRRMLESSVTGPATATAYLTAFGPVGCLIVRSHLPVRSWLSKLNDWPVAGLIWLDVPSTSGSGERKIASVVFWVSFCASARKAAGVPSIRRLHAPSDRQRPIVPGGIMPAVPSRFWSSRESSLTSSVKTLP